MVDERAVEPVQRGRGRRTVLQQNPQQVPAHAGDGRRLGALAADVTDGERELTARQGERVVEVTADRQPGERRVIARGELHAAQRWATPSAATTPATR